MTVGELILDVRSLGPDPCQLISAPTATTPASGGGGGSFPLFSQVFLVTTVLTPFGESAPSPETNITLSGGNSIISIPVSFMPGATSIRVYYGFAAGAESGYEEFVIPPGQLSPQTVLVLGAPVAAAVPPIRSSAFLPDSDGGFASASTVYRWLNESLKAAARVTGGIQDVCGVASVSGQRRYVVPGQWLRFNQCFYDGWELDLGNKAETFRNRNLTANISISLMVDAQSDTTRIELYWTPSRTSGTCSVAAPVGPTDTVIAITTPIGWLLQDGFAQLGSEIISYSAQTDIQLTGCIRQWNGTRAAALLQAPAPIAELNIELNGYRMPATYAVGDSQVTLGVPPGWEPFLKDYMLGLFRGAEQETDEGEKLKASALKGLAEWAKSNKPVAGPRQCRMYGDYGIRGLTPGGLTGGIIIP